jgi:outer membrane cobalamin receptor
VYGHQLAYTPRHSGSGQISLDTPYGQLSYNLTVCGERYILGQNIEENRLDGYSDHSLAYLKNFQWKHYQSRFKFEILNLLDENYAVIKYFPMPGRSIRASLSFSL